MQLAAALDAFLFAKELSPRTAEWYEGKLGAFIRWANDHTCVNHPENPRQLEDVDALLLREYLTTLRSSPSIAVNKKGRPPSSQTVHGYARALKAWMNWGISEDMVGERVVKKLSMPKKDEVIIEVFTPTQIAELFNACKRHYPARYMWLCERDKTILTLLLDTGIRASELCGLSLDDVRLSQDDSYIKVFGKGRKQRECPLGKRARQQVHRYIHQFRPSSDSQALFLTRAKQPLRTEGLSAILHSLKVATEMQGVRCSPHDFRHTFAFNYLANGGDILRLSRLLGHTDISVTSQYLKAFNSRDARRDYQSVADGILGR